MFLSAAFANSALGAQWSPLLIAALFIPTLAVFISVKPQLGLAVLAGNLSKRSIVSAGIGGIVLMSISLALLPKWPLEWFRAASTADHMRSPLFQPFGFLILLVLTRWRRPESWIVLTLACLPQTLMWYSFLILLAFPRAYREACVLSLVSSVGFFLAGVVAETKPTVERTGAILWAIVVFTTFLPAVISILRRTNEPRVRALRL
jgi:hypothetical protein